MRWRETIINVPIDRIVPLTDARDNFSRIVADIENQKDGMYVLTKGGKPAIALINISYLSELMNGTATLPKPHSPVVIPEKISEEPIKKEASAEPPKPISPPVAVPEKPKPVQEAPKPFTKPVVAPPINPSWTDQGSKNASAWPIQSPSAPITQNIPAPKPVTPPPAVPSPVEPPKPPMPPAPLPEPMETPKPPMPQMSAPAPVIPTAPKPVAPPPPPPPPANPVSQPVPIVVASKPDLPPPPANNTTIPFDEPPKTMIDPDEAPEEPTHAPLQSTQSSNPTPPVNPTPPATTSGANPPQPAVQDIDI